MLKSLLNKSHPHFIVYILFISCFPVFPLLFILIFKCRPTKSGKPHFDPELGLLSPNLGHKDFSSTRC